jgi:prepilin-type N-terminal cleavage/methylation domain-containing protein
MRNTNKGFTLVELIVVITILAILGTIAFISLGSYTADARNSKRLDGISKIATAVDNGLIGGSSILAFSTSTANALTTISLGGTGATAGTDYNAGEPNATALKINIEQFKDPSTTIAYPIAVARAAGGVFQVAATLEEGSTRRASVIWNFSERDASTKNTATGSTASQVVLSNVADINFFKSGDVVTDGTTAGMVVSNISSDGLTITLTGGTPAAGTLALNAAESTGMIGAAGNLANPVIDKDQTNFPYVIQ